jgi:myosin heavy subunit
LNERSFHSFYALAASKSYDTLEPSHYEFLKQSNCYLANNLDDKLYFKEINKSFEDIGFTKTEVDKIWNLMSSILKLGNITFVDANHIVDESKTC